MAHLNFVIPSNKQELLNETDDYYVRDILGPKDIALKLKNTRSQLREEGSEFIFDCFDVYYSVLHHGDTIPTDVIFRSYEDLHRATCELNKAIGFLMEDKEGLSDEMKIKFQNILKMTIYIYTQIILLIEQKNEAKNQGLNLKGRKKSNKENEGFSLDKKAIMLVLNNIMQRDIFLFWDPPVVDSNLVTIVSEVCYIFLQNPTIKIEKDLKMEIFNLLGTLIKEYSHGTSFVIRIVQLIKIYEHLVHSLPEGVQCLITNYNCKGLIHDLVVEITEWQTEETYQDSQGARNCAQILSATAVLLPELMIPELMYLNKYLAHDSATLRNSVLNVLTEVVLNVLTKHDLTDEERESRDEILVILMDHVHDVSAQVRSKVIQNFARLQRENAIPLKSQHEILQLVIERLHDKGALVRKSAIGCVTIFLSHNCFSSNLSLKMMRAELQNHNEALAKIKEQFEGIKQATQEKIENEWNQKKAALTQAIQEMLDEEELEMDHDGDNQLPKEQFADMIRLYIKEGKFKDAVLMCKAAGKENVDWQELQKTNEADQVSMYMTVLASIYLNPTKLMEELRENIVNKGLKITEEDLKNMESLEASVTYLEDSVKFLELIDNSLDTMVELLETTAIGDMQEAVEFFITAYQFNIDNSNKGVLAMLKIMQRNEQDRKEVIIDAFKTIYLKTDSKNVTEHANTIVNRLIELVKSVPISNLDDLELIVAEWTSKGVLDNLIIDMLWQYFTKKASVTDEDSRAAVELLRMASLGRKTIITRNIKLVATIAFKERGENSMLFFGSCCDLLAVAGKEKLDMQSKNPPFKIKANDEIFTEMVEILVKKFFEPVGYYYKALSGAIDFIYRLSSKPELTCETILNRVLGRLIDDMKNAQSEEVDTFLIIRLCQLLGLVAIRQLDFLDDTVYKELKRRNNIREERKENKRSENQNKKKGKKKNKDKLSATANESTIASLNESVMEGAQAEDMDAEFILNVLENDTVCGSGGLGKLAGVIKGICQRPDIYDCVVVQGAAVIALIRYMLVSSRFCEENIQLLFTIFEKTVHPEVKCSILVHLSDLLTRFPNIVEPWTPRICQRLKDPLDCIRKATFFTLSNLILRDMIRAHSHISEMVTCLNDEDPELSGMCKTFFINLSHKENNLYNVLPDIFSHLIESDTVTDAQMKQTMKFLFELMDKTKHMENLVDRFCTKFRLSEDLRHHQNIAYCLTLIHYNEKALKKLQENFPTYKHLVHDTEIYSCFKNIIQACNKIQVGKTDLKPLCTELEQSINSVFELDEDGTKKPNPVEKSTKKPKAKKAAPKKKGRKAARRYSDESDSD